ncbi:MAG: hypothetical protein HW404_397 [Anaerolineales bacterium]|nr:hypothetical protein [Anaerolineales bacterium]
MTERVRHVPMRGAITTATVLLLAVMVWLPEPSPVSAQCGLPGTPPCPPPKRPTKTPSPRPSRTPTPTPTATNTERPTLTPTPTATAVPCDTNVLTAVLDSLNEVPSVPSGAVGSVKLLFDLNAGSITGNWDIPFAGSITAAHIHKGPAGINAGVFIPLSGLPPGGSFATLNSALVAKLQDVLNDPAAFYVNVHTQPYPGGEIRGQLACAPAQPIASPTPAVTSTPVGGSEGEGRDQGAPLILWLGLGLLGLGGAGLIIRAISLRRAMTPQSDAAPEPMSGLGPGPGSAPGPMKSWYKPETSASPSPGTGPSGSPSTPPSTSATPDEPEPEPNDDEVE